MLFLILNLEICVHQMQMPSFGMPSMPGFGQLQMPSLTTMQSSQTRSTQQAQQAQQTQQAQQAQLAQAQQAQAQQAKISATTSTSSELAEQEFFVPLRHIAKVKPELPILIPINGATWKKVDSGLKMLIEPMLYWLVAG